MITTILAGILLTQSTPAIAPNPTEVLAKIAQVRATAAEAQKRGETFDQAMILAEQKQIADEALALIDVAKATPDECVLWARICGFTDKQELATAFAKKAYGSKSWDLLELERPLLIDEIRNGRIAEAISRIRNINFSAGPAMIGQFHLGIKSHLARLGEKSPEDLIRVYDELAARVHLESPLNNNDRHWAPVAYADIMGAKFSIMFNSGNPEEALAGLRELKSKMEAFPGSKDTMGKSAADYVAGTIARLTQTDTHGLMLNQPAPPIVYDRELGGFRGFEYLKGKVILLDFMAHWCGPCKAALPDIIKLQNRFGSQGLQTVSLTGYYGYYGSKQELTQEQEYAEMKSFVKEFKMDWPVIFDATLKNNMRYGISGIPQLVVIDRKGIVRRIEIGYTPEAFQETVKLVEKLIAESAD